MEPSRSARHLRLRRVQRRTSRRRVQGEIARAIPERLDMEILFKCLQDGTRYYAVRLNGQEIFVGSGAECERFISIHNRKVSEQQEQQRRPPRGRLVEIRTYKSVKAPA
jgi:hypothetical protein